MSSSTFRVAESQSLLSTAKPALQNPEQDGVYDERCGNDYERSAHSVRPSKNSREIRQRHAAKERHRDHQAERRSGQVGIPVADEAKKGRKHRGKTDTEQEYPESRHRNRAGSQQQRRTRERNRQTYIEYGEGWRSP